MKLLRPANTRGNPRASWISSYRTFSFPGYYDPNYMNYGVLQTINDDRVQPGGHVPWHEHKNMEIFGYIVEGVCHHTDSLGNVHDLPAGCVQRMSSGSSIWHTEGNSSTVPNHYLQIWIRPNIHDTEPIHEWHQFTREDKLNTFCEITAKLPIKQDAKLFAGIFTEGFNYMLDPKRNYYVYVISGTAVLNELKVVEGDGLTLEGEDELVIENPNESEMLLFDLNDISLEKDSNK